MRTAQRNTELPRFGTVLVAERRAATDPKGMTVLWLWGEQWLNDALAQPCHEADESVGAPERGERLDRRFRENEGNVTMLLSLVRPVRDGSLRPSPAVSQPTKTFSPGLVNEFVYR